MSSLICKTSSFIQALQPPGSPPKCKRNRGFQLSSTELSALSCSLNRPSSPGPFPAQDQAQEKLHASAPPRWAVAKHPSSNRQTFFLFPCSAGRFGPSRRRLLLSGLQFIHLPIFSSLQAGLIEAHTRKGPFKSGLQQSQFRSLAVKRRGAQTNVFCLLTKKWEEKIWCPSNTGHKNRFNSISSRSITPFSAVRNSMLVANPVQIRFGRRRVV